MSTTMPPRWHDQIKEAIRQRLANQGSAAPVQVSRILQDIRASIDTSSISDDELVEQIVMNATDRGLAVHFDQESP